MDKTRAYIELCGRADNIQRCWVQSYGDFYVDECGRVTCWLDNAPKNQRMKRGFAVCREGGVIRVSRYIWLPRQNQLIEMAQVRGRTYDNVTLDFYNWTKTAYGNTAETPGRSFPSMEQIWLAFVMQRKFSKIWDGSAWHRQPLF
jgi:hypothetical protein